jgi:hypothetical protein
MRGENAKLCLPSLRAKRSNPACRNKKAGLLRRFAPRNDGERAAPRDRQAMFATTERKTASQFSRLMFDRYDVR